ncbi:DUF6600 domain-containing protein [Fibrella forsythiae]|uniref:Uncharacterized protein n=1 Tax=Fibrella forsythiae TaxID=2817061 RepID=A0ABS3JCK3_9BACT|nr:DUF6600 domain-containing protein [Fibrella forsythiae]MBO0947715.1 hypothetical protein [Fibrella forsythiae]
MKTAGKLVIVLVGLTFSLAGVLSSCAQGSYNQPGYGQPGYGQTQPGYGQPGYDNGYDNQPGYNNQQGYNQYSGQPQDFYNELGPYGQWVQTPQYGTVWIPNVQPGFQPYATNGHWVVTEYGNTWVSDYAWGWGPFHYGRWYQDPRMGWAWVPGYDWGPAWVSWRSGGGYYGWAPLGPGINIDVNINIPANYWVFVPQIYITSPSLYSYYVPRPRVVNIYQQTTIINNVYRVNNRAYAYGPRRDEIERVTRRSVPVYRIENSRRPGRDEVRNNNSIGIYRPETTRGTRDSRGNDSRVYNAPFDNNRGGSRDDSRGNNVPGRSSGGSYGGNARTNNVPEAGSPVPTPGSYNGGGRGNAGSYGDPGNRANPANPNSTPSYPDRGQTRGGGGYGRPSYEAQQNQPMTQPGQPAQPSRPEATPQPQREWGGQRGGGSYSPPASPAPASPQPPSGGFENRQQPQAQPSGGREQRVGGGEQRAPGGQPQGGYSTGRGSSRGNN